YFILAGLVIAACSSRVQTPEERAEALARECLKMVRLEQQAQGGGAAVKGDFEKADSLFIQTVRNTDQSCIRSFVETGAGPCKEQLEAFLKASGRLGAPEAGDDPAAAIISVLQEEPESKERAKHLIEGYAAAFLINMDESREIGLRLDMIGFALVLGCPVTFRDLGLEALDSTRLKDLAARAAERTVESFYGTGPFEFFITMTRLNDVGGRFGGQADADTMAAILMERNEFQQILPRLQSMEPARIGFFGDSQMDNRHWSSPAHYPNIIAALFQQVNKGVTVFNAGVGGDDSGEGLARMDKDIIAQKPDICFVMFGGNDCAHWGRPNPSVSPEQFQKNMTDIVNRLQGASCRAVLMSYPLIPEFTGADMEVLQAMNEKLVTLRDSLSTGWLDIKAMFDQGDQRRLFALDGIHFSPEAHLLIAGKVLEYLVSEPGH
ncbi:MAG TPA: SGNH/GDSL hydrolase family protein, partial [archaeon]|nr:SGNH/GDSL hydrolase family protein [archaeon]